MMKTLSALFAAALLIGCEGPRNDVVPEEAAARWATNLELHLQGKPTCTQVDTDDDGYVTCSLAVKEKEGEPAKLVSLQCAAMNAGGCSTYASGCKITEPKIRVEKSE